MLLQGPIKIITKNSIIRNSTSMIENNKISLCFMLQARLGSTRLQNKMILPFFQSKGVLELLIEKLKYNFPNIPVILATSEEKSNDILEELANKLDCLVYRGDENDVLQRFIDAANHFNVSKIIRVCADNPFLDVNELHRLIDFSFSEQCFDYISFQVNSIPSIKTHFGFWTEFVTLDALKKINQLTDEKYYHEHVTNYIYENLGSFKIEFLGVNPIFNQIDDIRMTLDTGEDFKTLSEIYLKLTNKYDRTFGLNEIVQFLDIEKDYKRAMIEQIMVNTK